MKCGTIPLRFIGDSIFFKQTWFVLGEKEAKFGLYASSDLKEWHMVAANFNNYARLVEAGGRLFCYRHPYCGERSAFCDMMWSDTGFEWQPVFFDLENGFPHYVLDILLRVLIN